MLKTLRPALVMIVLADGAHRPRSIRLAMTGVAERVFPSQAQWQPDREGRHGDRLDADRPGLHQRRATSTAAPRRAGARPAMPRRRWQRPTTPPNSMRLQSGPDHQGADRPHQGRRRQAARRRTPARRCRWISSPPRGSGLDPHITPGGARFSRCRASPRRAACRRRGARSWSPPHVEGRLLGLLGEPRVNVLALNLGARWRQHRGEMAEACRAAGPAVGLTGRSSEPRVASSARRRMRCSRRRRARGSRAAASKIFLGAAPGVGKTYEMLQFGPRPASWPASTSVIGVVETHGRRETEALVAGFEIVPARSDRLSGPDARARWTSTRILARRPQLVLVDELAHTNAAGSRHPKRYLDVEELLAAGIDVYTTLNIQHVESLNDVVAQITRRARARDGAGFVHRPRRRRSRSST